MNEFKYVGSELTLFAAVDHWKSYWSKRIREFVVGDVLEVGAGIGSNTPYLDRGKRGRWVCLEPDPSLVAQMTSSLSRSNTQQSYEVVCGTLQNTDLGEFDTILYIDVLEHIEDDRKELEHAAQSARAGGRIIVLAPAHQRLFTAFDSAIGHYRRYNRRMLRSISPRTIRLEQMWYLDSVGLALSIANRYLLRQAMPTEKQLRFWDKCIVPASRVLDTCLCGSLGKSIVAIWRR